MTRKEREKEGGIEQRKREEELMTGFAAQANEYSTYMLIASNFVLNQ
jgi:hypothetical protein